jgi:hypothetical protein
MARRTPRVTSRLPDLLARRNITWGELGRRALLPPRHVRALRTPHANPPLAVAERVAQALGAPIEDVWALLPRAKGS